MISFDDFKAEWLGRRVDFDHVYSYQCVDIVLQYIFECYGINGAYGNALDWWTNPDAKLLTKFTKVNDNTIQKGDIAVFKTVGHDDYTGDGHIGIATGNGDPNSIEILEQNGMGSGTGLGRDAIHTRFIPRNRVAGTLRPIPVAPANPISFYEPLPVHTKQTNKQPTNWWNLNGTTLDINSFHPAAVLNVGTPFVIGGIAHHINGRNYAMSPDDFNRAQNGDMSTNNGVNTDDLSELPAPLPVTKPPAAPVTVPKVTYYSVMPDIIMYYGNAPDAQARRNALGTKNKGQYILLGSDEQARQIVKKNTDRDIIWVNDFDNKLEEVKLDVPVVPTLPVDPPKVVTEVTDVADNTIPPLMPPAVSYPSDKPKPQYQWINNNAPSLMQSINSMPITVHDLEGKYSDQKLPANWKGEFSMYANVGGVTYYIPDKMRKAGWNYGVPATMLRPVKQVRLDVNHDGTMNLQDVVSFGDFIMTESKRAYTRLIAPVLTDLKTDKAKQAVSRISKAVDGFSSVSRKKGK